MTRLYTMLLLMCFSISTYAASNDVTLKVGGHRVMAEVAHTAAQRNKGLMGRENLKKDHGMLFVFHSDDYYAMWMKDTPSPLSVAFIDANGKILNVAEMLPYTEESHFSEGRARYALEMAAGWFRQNNVSPGAKVQGLTKAPPAKD